MSTVFCSELPASTAQHHKTQQLSLELPQDCFLDSGSKVGPPTAPPYRPAQGLWLGFVRNQDFSRGTVEGRQKPRSVKEDGCGPTGPIVSDCSIVEEGIHALSVPSPSPSPLFRPLQEGPPAS